MRRLVFMLCVLLFYSSAQNDTGTEFPNDVICSTCSCADNIVDCTNKNIQNVFANEDWEALQNMAPISFYMSGNPVTSFPRFPLYLPIQSLNLSNCQLEKMADAAFMNLIDLVSLDLSWNRLTTSSVSRRVFVGQIKTNSTSWEINRVFSFENMRTISLAHNELTALPKDLFHFMIGLTNLDLSGNPLVIIDQVSMGTITELEKLEELKLSDCQLENIPEGMLRRLTRLQILDLSGNRFTTAPGGLAESYNLVYLDLSRNLIECIEENGPLHSLTKLKELHLSDLATLKTIGERSLGGLKNLVTLHIRRNPRLSYVDPTFLTWNENEQVRWPVLTELYLDNNNLSTIDAHLLERWDQLVRIDFSGSSYSCDCRQQWMVDVLVSLVDRSGGDAGQMICQTPKDVKGLSFRQLFDTSKKLPCPSERTRVATTSSGVIVGVMIGILVTFPMVLVIVILWRRGYFAECRRKRQNQYLDYDDDDAF